MAIRIPTVGPQNRANTLGQQPAFENFIYIDSYPTPVGSPISLILNGSQDGMAVCLPSSLGTNTTLVVGIASNNPVPLNSNAVIDVVVHGVHNAARVSLGVRTATNVTFGSWSAYNPGDALSVDVTNNVLSKNTGGNQFFILQPIQASTGGASSFTGGVQSATVTVATFVGTVPSTTQLAQTYQILVTPNGLAAYVPAKVYVRLM